LALPLVNGGRVVGVVALYRREKDAFAADELVTLLELCPALASLILDTIESGDTEPRNTEPRNNLLEMAHAVSRDGERLVGR
jgi:signal transduction protein with GAF and PtsI domain